MTSVELLGPVDAVLAGLPLDYVLLGLVLLNILTRAVAHRSHVKQAAEGGADAISRHPVHVVTNVLLVLTAFYYMTLHHHSGLVTSVLVLGVIISDFFEFEARKVEARRDIEIERPKSAIMASVLALTYVSYLALFFLIADYWGAVV
jgi:hypothetical protein